MKKTAMMVSVVLVGLLLAGCGQEKNDFIDRMVMEHQNDTPVANESVSLGSPADVTTDTVTYATVAGNDITGYLAKPEGMEEPGPGLIVIHEWWGLNDNIRMMTRKLAGEGYTALAVDLYNGKVATTSDSASRYARSVDANQAVSNLTQAHSYLTNEHSAGNVGTIGWCFGGGWSLQTALALPGKIDATVIYYGRLVTDKKQLKPLQMPILGHFGSEDRGIPPKTARQFESVLNDLGKDASIHIYEGAGHAFANPSGNRYDKEAAEKAWQRTTSFLEEHLKEQM